MVCLMNKIEVKRCLFSALILLTGMSAFSQTNSREAREMERQGMVNVHSIDKSIQVSLMYSRADNFTRRVLYSDLREAYLHPQAARALKQAQKRLKKLRPDLSLKIYDACRPMSIQQKMWNAVKRTKKFFYVSNPAHGGGLHNYGLAVDITLCRLNGDTIPMGTKIDYMGASAHIDNEHMLVAKHRISKEALENRRLLRKVMRYAGFKPLRTEWWHFNFKSRRVAKAHYKVVR
jgi:D-alanyl-D-alanine dipeptidase